MIPVFITLLTAVLCRTTETPLAQYIQPDASLDCPWVKINNFIIFEIICLFSVPDLRNDCIENCEIEMIECFIGCNNDSACLRECLRGETDCIQCKLQFNSCQLEKPQILEIQPTYCDYFRWIYFRLSVRSQLLGWLWHLQQPCLWLRGEFKSSLRS